MLVLGFDTSAAHVTAALLQGDTLLATKHEDMGRGQAERLMPLLEEVLFAGEATWQDLDRVGVGIGPGNFTGIRISVSAARGLALGLGIPAIGVSSLEAQAYEAQNVLSCLPAPRGQAYLQAFCEGINPTSRLSVLDADALSFWSPSAADACVIGPNASDVAKISHSKVMGAKYPLAEAIARIALQSEATGTRPAPLYLKPADAAPSRTTPPTILT